MWVVCAVKVLKCFLNEIKNIKRSQKWEQPSKDNVQGNALLKIMFNRYQAF